MSIAAVLVLGIGVSLRMQLEQPGIETSAPASEPTPAPASEYSMPPSAEPSPDPAPAAAASDAAKPSPASKAARENRQDKPRVPKPFADEQFRERTRPEVAAPQAVPAAPPAPAFAPSPRPALESLQAAPVQPPAAVRAQEAPAAAQGAPLRAKREAMPDSTGARELRKSLAQEADPDRELERIARLREAGNHAEADAALAEFRRRRPDYRIPEGMWERVKPR